MTNQTPIPTTQLLRMRTHHSPRTAQLLPQRPRQTQEPTMTNQTPIPTTQLLRMRTHHSPRTT